MAGGGPLAVREYGSAEEARAHAAAVRERMFPTKRFVFVRPPPKPPELKRFTADELPKGHVTTKLIAAMRKARVEGKLCREIAEDLGVHPRTVQKYTKDLRVKARGGKSPSVALEVLRELRTEGLGYREIADRVGLDMSTVWRRINEPNRSLKDQKCRAILTIISDVTGVDRDNLIGGGDVRGGSRKSYYVKARHILFWVVNRRLCRSLPWTARAMGGFDHTTVRHAAMKVDKVISHLTLPHDVSITRQVEALWGANWDFILNDAAGE